MKPFNNVPDLEENQVITIFAVVHEFVTRIICNLA